MKRCVVTHHCPARCRHHRATSRCTAGRVWRRDCGRGGTRVARAPLPRLRLPLPRFQPAQQAGGPHLGHGMPLTPRPQAALVLVPAQRPRGRFVKLCARMPPLRVVRPRLRPRPPHGHRPGGLGLTVAAGHGNLAVAHLAQGPRILSLHPFQHDLVLFQRYGGFMTLIP
jgi:hypothetical protein